MIQYIDQVEIKDKRVLLRVDFNVSLKADGSINNDDRIKRALITIKRLLANGNTLILISHLGQPKEYDATLTTERLAIRLQELVSQPVLFIPFDKTFDSDFCRLPTIDCLALPKLHAEEGRLFMLDNIRFHPGEKKNDPEFAKQLASLADVYVNDAFGVSHRPDASVVGVPVLIPHYGGLLMKEEVESIRKAILNPAHPLIAIIAGAKVSTKIGLIEKLMALADHVLIGGAIVNNFFKLKGLEIGKGSCEMDHLEEARHLLGLDAQSHKLMLPIDRRIGSQSDEVTEPTVKNVENISPEDETLDIGPETEKLYIETIRSAKTIIWNGPVGYFENPKFAQGSIAIFNAITANPDAVSIVGGGDTLSVIKKLPNQDKITHISTGGGAMLELVEKGTLPGIEALEQ